MNAGKKKPLCPECGKPATGNFCQECGAKLGGRFCNQCGAKIAPAASFCNQCGAKAGDGGDRRSAAAAVVGGGNLPWWIAGAAMFVVILVVGVNMVQPGPPAAPATAPAAVPAAGGGAPPDLSSMTPREAADRLFNRVMTAVSGGDSLQAQQFLPMAIAAYERARPLDHDGLYHMSLLNRAALNLDEALANALEVLGEDPNHLLALSAAAEAAIELGRLEEAEAHYRHLLEVLDAERARALPEYEMHSLIVEAAGSEAEAFLAGR